MKAVSRRTVLRGFGGAAVALPYLDIMAMPRHARAQAAISKMGANGRPKRFVVLFTPCGQGSDWYKNSNGADGKLVLAPALAPLVRHKDDLLFVDGVDMNSCIKLDTTGLDSGHSKPMAHLMTCTPVKGNLGGGISIDEAIAKEVAGDTKFPSLHLGVVVDQSGANAALSYSGPGLPLPHRSDPLVVFKGLFIDLKTDPALLLRLQAERKSVLDGIAADLAEFSGKMSGEDRLKVDAHLSGVRDVEKRLTTDPAAATLTCKAPTAPTGGSGGGPDGYVSVGNTMMDLLAMAMACDLTRVGTIMWQGSGGNVRLPGFGRGIHDASHDYGSPERNSYTKWHAEYFAKFIDKLKGLQEAGGSVLDNTLIYWCSEHAAGNHNYDRMTIMMAGSAGGYFKTGRYVKTAGASASRGLGFCQYKNCPGTGGPSHSDLYVSFLNAMGSTATTFGNPAVCTGPLQGLTA